jgi:hypothetical protein
MNGFVIAGLIFVILWHAWAEHRVNNGMLSGHPIIPEPNNLLATEEEE